METIILAGGLGTRLKLDAPKPMAPIKGKPFLAYLLTFLKRQNISKVILAVSYKSNVIKEYFGDHYKGIKIVYSIQEELLGTGGAIKEALKHTTGKDVFILNGDSFYQVDLNKMQQTHQRFNSDILFSLKKMDNYDRYGSVLTVNDRVVGFDEKKQYGTGTINAGVYLAKTRLFDSFNVPLKFSFESDFLKKYFKELSAFGMTCDGYFIDIGIPDDYERAKKELPEHISMI